MAKIPANFRGIITAIELAIVEVSEVDEVYPANYRGIVEALRDLKDALDGDGQVTITDYPANYRGIVEVIVDIKNAIDANGGAGGTDYLYLSNLYA